MNILKNILKRLFCKHDYKYSCNGIETHSELDFSGDGGYNHWQEYYTEYICTKCGKKKRTYKLK